MTNLDVLRILTADGENGCLAATVLVDVLRTADFTDSGLVVEDLDHPVTVAPAFTYCG